MARLRILPIGRVHFGRIEDAYSSFRLTYFLWRTKKKRLKGSTIALSLSLVALAIGAVLWNTEESSSVACSIGTRFYSVAISAAFICFVIASFSLPGFFKKRNEKRNALKDIGTLTGGGKISMCPTKIS